MSGVLWLPVFACGLALWAVVRGKDDNGVVVNAKLLQRVEDLADVVIPSISLSP